MLNDMKNPAPIFNQGFTLAELLLTMGIISLLFAVSSILISNLIPKTNLSAQAETLVSELRHQQLKAMTAQTGGTNEALSYGLHVSSQEYVLFQGETYDPAADTNFFVELKEPLYLETTFPNQQLVFKTGSGQIVDYNSDFAQLMLNDAQTGKSVIIKFNQYGVIKEINQL